MFFNRMTFNRPGSIMYAEADLVSAGEAFAGVRYAEAAMNASGAVEITPNRIRSLYALLAARGVIVSRLTTRVFVKSVCEAASGLLSTGYKYMAVTVPVVYAAASGMAVLSWDSVLRFNECRLLGKSMFQASPALFAVETLSLAGLAFGRGDIIEIDLDHCYVTQNGLTLMDQLNGNFFKFYPGENTLIWQDDQEARAIEMKVHFQNKYL